MSTQIENHRFSNNLPPKYTPSTISQQPLLSDSSILLLLQQQAENFSELSAFVRTKDIKPSILFLPQTLKLIDNEFDFRSNLVYECLDYIDIVKFYSMTIYGDPESFLNNVKKLIVENRTVNNSNHVLSRNTLDDLTFKSKEEALEFLDNNKLLLSIYLFSLVSLIFFSPN